MKENFLYENIEVTKRGGKKIVRKVSIKNNKAVKSVTKYHRGRHLGTVKKTIDKTHIEMIRIGKFVKGLFNDCNCVNNKKTRKNKK
jgi:hypothetical protein